MEKQQALTPVKEWRKIKYIHKIFKSQFQRTFHQVFKGKWEQAQKQSVQQYLHQARLLEASIAALLQHPPVAIGKKISILAIILLLDKYKKYVTKFTDQIVRRLLKQEVIPAAEEIFSIFEENTEWITKGKQNKKVELGHLLLITSNQYQFIILFAFCYPFCLQKSAGTRLGGHRGRGRSHRRDPAPAATAAV